MKTLKLNGKPFDLDQPKPTISRMLSFLEKAPDDELFTTSELNSRLGIGHSSMQYATDARLAPYRTHPGQGVRTLWGSKAAIAEYARQLAAIR